MRQQKLTKSLGLTERHEETQGENLTVAKQQQCTAEVEVKRT